MYMVSSPPDFKYARFIWSSAFMLLWLSLYAAAPAVRRIMSVPVTPHTVQISRDGRRLFAVGSIAGQIKMAAEGAAPDGGARGDRAYVSNAEDDAVAVVDVARGRVVSSIATAASPYGLRMSPDSREIYVAATKGNAVSVIDVATSREVARIQVGKAPVQVGFTPDGTRVYVSLRDDNAVAVVDTRTRRLMSTIPVWRSPIQVFATPDGNFMYVANQGTEREPDNTVSVIDTRLNVYRLASR